MSKQLPFLVPGSSMIVLNNCNLRVPGLWEADFKYETNLMKFMLACLKLI